MRHLIVLSVLAGALAVTGTASAGGWATVGVEPLPTAAGVGPGDPWNPEITVLQHGVTPLGGLTPVVTIREAGSGNTEQFIANETAEVGVYEAEVVFPAAGDWNVVVDSGFGDSRLTFGPETIVDTTGGVTTDSFPVLPVAGVAAFLALLAGATFAFRKRWRPTPLPR